jgi:hypothetical protein
MLSAMTPQPPPQLDAMHEGGASAEEEQRQQGGSPVGLPLAPEQSDNTPPMRGRGRKAAGGGATPAAVAVAEEQPCVEWPVDETEGAAAQKAATPSPVSAHRSAPSAAQAVATPGLFLGGLVQRQPAQAADGGPKAGGRRRRLGKKAAAYVAGGYAEAMSSEEEDASSLEDFIVGDDDESDYSVADESTDDEVRAGGAFIFCCLWYGWAGRMKHSNPTLLRPKHSRAPPRYTPLAPAPQPLPAEEHHPEDAQHKPPLGLGVRCVH